MNAIMIGSESVITEKLFQEIQHKIPDFTCRVIKTEPQNLAYEGLLVDINHTIARSRLAKKTPGKKGYFVAFWEKDKHGVNQAYHYEKSPNLIIVSVVDGDRRGQFIFPRKILLRHSVLKHNDQKGKMALRVYPEWVKDLNKHACRQQAWQIDYFVDLSKDSNHLPEVNPYIDYF